MVTSLNSPYPLVKPLPSQGVQHTTRERRAKRFILPEYLEFQEVETLLACAPGPEAKLLIQLQWRAGLRVSEALALEPSDLHLKAERPLLRVNQGKGRKDRLVPLHPVLLNDLAAFVAIRKPKGKVIPVGRVTAWRWIRGAYLKAVKEGRFVSGRKLGTHTLRHSAARHWLANGIPINVVQLWLGHAKLETTLIYLKLLPGHFADISRVP